MLETGKVKVWAFSILIYFLGILHSVPCTYETDQLEANFVLPKRSLIGLFRMHGILKGIPCPSWFLIIRFPGRPWSWAAADTRSRLWHFQQKALLMGMKAHLWGSESNALPIPEDLGAAESVMWVKTTRSVPPSAHTRGLQSEGVVRELAYRKSCRPGSSPPTSVHSAEPHRRPWKEQFCWLLFFPVVSPQPSKERAGLKSLMVLQRCFLCSTPTPERMVLSGNKALPLALVELAFLWLKYIFFF